MNGRTDWVEVIYFKKIKKGVDKPNQICYISNIAYKEL